MSDDCPPPEEAKSLQAEVPHDLGDDRQYMDEGEDFDAMWAEADAAHPGVNDVAP